MDPWADMPELTNAYPDTQQQIPGVGEGFPSLASQFPTYGGTGSGGGGGGGGGASRDNGPVHPLDFNREHFSSPWGVVAPGPNASFAQQNRGSPWNTPPNSFPPAAQFDQGQFNQGRNYDDDADWSRPPQQRSYPKNAKWLTPSRAQYSLPPQDDRDMPQADWTGWPDSSPYRRSQPELRQGGDMVNWGDWPQTTPNFKTTPLTRSTSLFGSGPRASHKRPEDWRPDFRSRRPGLSRIFSSKTSSNMSLTRNVLSFMGVTQLHNTIVHRSPPGLLWDLRTDPGTLQLARDRHAFLPLELQEAATNPPLTRMRLFHTKLPWYINVMADEPNIITISHLLWTIYLELHRAIEDQDYYCEEIDQEGRERIYGAWHKRTKGDHGEAMKGVLRVDFLGDKFIFEGLKKKDDAWEIKTAVRRQ